MILDIKPIAHIKPVAINRHGLAPQSLYNHQGY